MLEIAINVAIGAGVLIVLAGTLIALRAAVTRTPATKDIVTALMPLIYGGIYAAENLALKGLTELGTKMNGLDKKAIADSTYDRIPDPLMVGSIPVPVGIVKLFISRKMFEELVEGAFQQADSFLLSNEAYLKKQVDLFANTNLRVPPSGDPAKPDEALNPHSLG